MAPDRGTRTLDRARATLNRFLRHRFGYEVRSTRRPPTPTRSEAPALGKSAVLYDVDEQFDRIVRDGVTQAGATIGADARPGVSPLHRTRLYNLAQALRMTAGTDGVVAECGCYQGMSSYVLCRYLAEEQPGFDGSGVHVFDSFEGLSPLAAADRPDDPSIPIGGRPRQAGMFAASVEHVRATLAEFPGVDLHAGWIPEVLGEAPPGPYRLVHIDVDIHDPTRDSLELFHPLLAPGGVIVSDDYGSVRWPGSRAAIDAFCERERAPLLVLSTGQALIFRADDRRA